MWCDEYPVLSQTFVANEASTLAALGHPVEVVAGGRPASAPLRLDGPPVRYLSDETGRQRRLALLRVAARHPLVALRDRLDRRRWSGEETPRRLRELAPAIERLAKEPGTVTHVHFAAGAALDALRVARFTGRPWSLTAHAYDIYLAPRNLREKLRSAGLVTSGCDYTVADLRALGRSEDVHRIVMGVDPARFRRAGPDTGGSTVIAIGRLVEKKGFIHLVRAAAQAQLDDVVIVGEGPLRATLEGEIDRLGLGKAVRLLGARQPEQVRTLLGQAAVLAMPCVVAGDGDRDSMPVVVKEALAMEVPVVASDEVGLPEMVRPDFGRLVPPGDPAALAAALVELLDLDPSARAAMGRAGRAFVAEHANLHIETARLSDLLQAL